jgi:hypothetical protein
MIAMSNDKYETQPTWLKRLLSDHPAFLFSITYIVASLVGMFFSWNFLRRFGINVFHYAEIGDFLLASLKEPYTWGLVIFALLLMAGDNALSQFVANKMQRRWLRWYASPLYRALNYLVAIVIVVVFINAHASSKARHLYAGGGDVLTITLADGAPPREAVLLDTTGRFLFLYYREDDRVDIHPHEAVLMIRKVRDRTH